MIRIYLFSQEKTIGKKVGQWLIKYRILPISNDISA